MIHEKMFFYIYTNSLNIDICERIFIEYAYVEVHGTCVDGEASLRRAASLSLSSFSVSVSLCLCLCVLCVVGGGHRTI